MFGVRYSIFKQITAIASVALTVFLGYYADRNQFLSFIAAYALFFALYIWVCFYQGQTESRFWINLGIALRVLLLFSLPNLSDDFYRFIWDGRLTMAGYHPFIHTPRYFVENQIFTTGVSVALFNKLNSPDYFTVYPPVSQVIFAISAWFSAGNDRLAVVIIKLFLLLGEIGVIRILARQFNQPKAAVLYALNPLVILELTGNCHFEGLMVFFILLGILTIRKTDVLKSAVYWALAVATKLLPVLFVPLVWRWLGWRRGLQFVLWFGLFSLILFLPLLAVFPQIFESIDLYFREFQFNASIYYLVREIGFAKIGWDIGEFSGPALAALALLGVLLISLFGGWKKQKSESLFASIIVFSLFLYYSLAAVVQPWYLCVPFALSLITPWRFMIWWTGLVALSYSHYDGGGREEHFWLIGLEYGVLWGILLWDVLKRYTGDGPID